MKVLMILSAVVFATFAVAVPAMEGGDQQEQAQAFDSCPRVSGRDGTITPVVSD